MIFRVLIVMVLGLGVAGCGVAKRVVGLGSPKSATPLPYKARLSKGNDRHDFAVSVANKGAGVAAVRESVRFPATEHCLFNFGGSEIDWVIDPVTGDWDFVQDGQNLIFAGRCTTR